MTDNPFRIPQTLRDMSEQNIKQAHAAYEQLAAFVTKAMGNWTGAMPSNLIPPNLMTGFKELRDRAVAMAKTNAELALALVERIGKAQNFQDVFGLQSRFAQEQMQTYAGQTQEIGKLIGETLQKHNHG